MCECVYIFCVSVWVSYVCGCVGECMSVSVCVSAFVSVCVSERVYECVGMCV